MLNYFFAPVYEGEDPPTPKTFTEEEFNRAIEEAKSTAKGQLDKLNSEIQALQAKAKLTAQEREDLKNKLDEINNSSLTKEELARKKLEKLEGEYKAYKEDSETRIKAWENRYTEATISRSLTDAAVANNAFSPDQIVAILRSRTKLTEVLKDGEPTGEYEVKVSLPSVDKDKKPIVLELSPTEAVKMMTEDDKYLNLFRDPANPGTGIRSSKNSSGTIDPIEAAKDPERYRKLRAEGKIRF